jgi:SOS-response transcriptional repressor LexA
MARIREEVRLRNLELLVGEAGSAVKLARQAKTSPSYLSQIRRGLPTAMGKARSIGDELAHKLEVAMRKPHGWMDEPHAHPAQHHQLRHRYGRPGSGHYSGLHPVITWGSAAAAPQEHTEELTPLANVEEERLPCPVPCSEDTFVLRVEGESMEPKFHHGDLIYVDPDVSPEHGRYVVLRLEGADEAILRQLIVEGGRRYFKALNPDWPDRIVEASDEVAIRGVVVFKGETA